MAASHLFYAATRALCAECLRVVDAKELIEGDSVWLQKRCPVHGLERVLLSDDVAYFRRTREVFIKPGDRVAHHNTGVVHGCPFDCGICPDHEQHGCVTLLEITDHCNLRCPTCYAASGPERELHRPLAQIEAMLDRIIHNEGEPDVVQVSGGEPTIHPQFFDVLDACRRRPIRHLMVNTNGLRIAEDAAFVDRLASYVPRFEVYLQLDSLRRGPLMALRGRDLRAVHDRALERLEARAIPTTLVATVRRGLNDDELGDIVRHALEFRCVRGVTFQPVQDAGRVVGFDAGRDRLTLSAVRRGLIAQFEALNEADVLPVPCHPDCIAMAYGLRDSRDRSRLVPLTRYVSPELLLSAGGNTISYERVLPTGAVRDALFDLLRTGQDEPTTMDSLKRVLCCLPEIAGPPTLRYEDVFRIVIMQFLDRHTIEQRSVRRTCVHIAHPDGRRIIPFDTYNVLYRDGLERSRGPGLVALRSARP